MPLVNSFVSILILSKLLLALILSESSNVKSDNSLKIFSGLDMSFAFSKKFSYRIRVFLLKAEVLIIFAYCIICFLVTNVRLFASFLTNSGSISYPKDIALLITITSSGSTSSLYNSNMQL